MSFKETPSSASFTCPGSGFILNLQSYGLSNSSVQLSTIPTAVLFSCISSRAVKFQLLEVCVFSLLQKALLPFN